MSWYVLSNCRLALLMAMCTHGRTSPTYTGGTTSPDFVYAIRGEDSGEIALHFIVETKSDNPRVSDKIALDAQRKAFAAIGGNIKCDVKTNVADFE